MEKSFQARVLRIGKIDFKRSIMEVVGGRANGTTQKRFGKAIRQI